MKSSCITGGLIGFPDLVATAGDAKATAAVIEAIPLALPTAIITPTVMLLSPRTPGA